MTLWMKQNNVLNTLQCSHSSGSQDLRCAADIEKQLQMARQSEDVFLKASRFCSISQARQKHWCSHNRNAKALTDHIFSSLLLFRVWGAVYGVDRWDWFQQKPLITFLKLPSGQPLWSWPTQTPKNHFNRTSNLRGLNAWPATIPPIWAKEHQN